MSIYSSDSFQRVAQVTEKYLRSDYAKAKLGNLYEAFTEPAGWGFITRTRRLSGALVLPKEVQERFIRTACAGLRNNAAAPGGELCWVGLARAIGIDSREKVSSGGWCLPISEAGDLVLSQTGELGAAISMWCMIGLIFVMKGQVRSSKLNEPLSGGIRGIAGGMAFEAHNSAICRAEGHILQCGGGDGGLDEERLAQWVEIFSKYGHTCTPPDGVTADSTVEELCVLGTRQGYDGAMALFRKEESGNHLMLCEVARGLATRSIDCIALARTVAEGEEQSRIAMELEELSKNKYLTVLRGDSDNFKLRLGVARVIKLLEEACGASDTPFCCAVRTSMLLVFRLTGVFVLPEWLAGPWLECMGVFTSPGGALLSSEALGAVGTSRTGLSWGRV